MAPARPLGLSQVRRRPARRTLNWRLLLALAANAAVWAVAVKLMERFL